MPNSVSKRYSRIALLAVLAVIASLFVLPVAPSGAATDKADFTADFTACPSDVISDAGFSDTASSFATAEIDCIAYYGITQGAGSATTYNPSGAVLRWQMALFLTRAAGPAGITLPAATDQGFTDIGDLPQATQDAINQLAALGITKGKGTATTFAPTDPVTRQQMALFLARFLDDVKVGPGGTDIDNVTNDDEDQFTDISQVSVEMFNAINDLFELGVTTGTGDGTTFSPTSVVSRAQMAAFISRSLAHSNARPAGVNIQADPTSDFGAFNTNVSISYRDSNFAPVANQLVDVFSKTVDTGKTLAAPLKADGTCDGTQSGDCTLSLADNATNSSGNIALVQNVASGKTTQWWAWTGDTGDSFDADTETAATVTVVSNVAGAGVKASTDIAKNAATLTINGNAYTQAKYGSTVTVTAQLTTTDGGTTAAAQSGVNVIFTETRFSEDGTSTVSINSTTVKTDADGKATFTVSISDPDTGTWATGTATDDESPVLISVNGPGATDPSVRVVFNDDPAAAATLKLSQSAKYTVASDSGLGAAHTVMGTLYDQYGAGVSSTGVQFSNNDELLGGVVRFTNSSGVATLSWNRDAATAESDTVSAVADTDGDNDFTDSPGSLADDGDLTVYWATELADGGTSAGAQTVLVWDAENDAVVYAAGGDSNAPTIVYYDSNDQFNAGGAVTYTVFDEAVADEPDAGTYTTVNVTAYDTDAGSVSSFTLN